MLTEKDVLHRYEDKRDRRKARKKKLTPEQIEHREWERAAKIIHGEMILRKFIKPFVEESKQREISENLSD